jgi:hypothetical protein
MSAILLSPSCFASIFGKDKSDPPQWGLDAAKTRTPDYAKDASSVVLFDEYVETIDAQGRAVEREREAIRILKPQGRHEACEVAYSEDEKINYFRVWTIAADEKRYQAKDSDFTEYGDTDVPVMLSTEKYRVARPPAVDVDAVLICESEELLAPFDHEKVWRVQSSTPIVFQALEIDLPPGRPHSNAWHNYKGVKPSEVAPNHWRWEIKDMPALLLRDIPSPPEWGAVAARMSVQWGDAAVEGKDNQWRALGQQWTELEAHRADPSPEITAKTQQLIAGAPDYYSKLSRITEFIQKNIRYFVVIRGIGGWQAHPAPDVFRHQYGDCKDKATLLISMLQVADIRGYYVLVDHRRLVVDPEAPSSYGDHMITAIEVPANVDDPRLKALVKAKDGKRYLIFDPTDEYTPVGNLPSNEQGSYGVLVAGAASQILPLPVLAPEANGTERKGAFTLTADGTLSGTVDTSHSGPEGSDFRWTLKFKDEKERRDYWESELIHSVPGAVLDSLDLTLPSALDQPLQFHYKLTAHQYAHTAGPLLLLRPRVVGSDGLPHNDKPRTVAIELNATGRWHDSYDIALPDGYVVDEMPEPVNLDLDFASYHSSITAKDKHLHYEREYTVRQVQLAADRQPEFLHLEGAILSDEKATVVLKKQ